MLSKSEELQTALIEHAAVSAEYDDVLDPINRVFLPRADIATEQLVEGLTKLGWEVDDVTAYRTVRAAPPAAETREAIKAMARAQGHKSAQFVLVGETALEEDWAYTGQTAGFLTGDRFFAACL